MELLPIMEASPPPIAPVAKGPDRAGASLHDDDRDPARLPPAPAAADGAVLAPIAAGDGRGWARRGDPCMDACVASMLRDDAVAAGLRGGPSPRLPHQLLPAVRAALQALLVSKKQEENASLTEGYEEEEEAVPDSPQGIHINFFGNALTAPKTRTHDGFSLFLIRDPPHLEVVAKDLHGVHWRFRLIVQGQPQSHLLQSGWSDSVSAERLVSGDAFRFVRDEDRELNIGFQRALRHQTTAPSLAISSHSMHLGVLSKGFHLLATGNFFSIYYEPRTSRVEFIVSCDRYCQYQIQNYSTEMRFKMRFEGEEVGEKRFDGTMDQIEPSVSLPPVKLHSAAKQWKDNACGRPHMKLMLQQVPVAPPEGNMTIEIPRELGVERQQVPRAPPEGEITVDIPSELGAARQQVPHAPPEGVITVDIQSELGAERQQVPHSDILSHRLGVERQQVPRSPPEGEIIIGIPSEMGAARQQVSRADIASHRLEAERELTKQWKFILKVLLFLGVVFTLVGIFGAVGAVYLKVGNFLKWRIKTWILQFIHLAVSWTITKPMSWFRDNPIVKLVLPFFCFINDIGTAVIFCSAVMDYLSLRCYLLMPVVIISLIPFSCWSIYMKKKVSFLPIASWSATIVVTIFNADLAGWIPLPGHVRISDYGGVLVAVSFLIYDLRNANYNAPVLKTAVELYMEMAVESSRRLLSTVTKAFVFT